MPDHILFMNHIISIIIPCKSRLSHLMECMPYILNQTYHDLQVIIIDFNCPEKTKEVILNSFNDKRIEVYKEPVSADHWNLCEARNAGYKYAKGDTLLFLDADTILQPTFIEMAVKDLNKKTFVTGLVQPPWNGCGCMMVNRVDFANTKGYNESLVGWGYDDMDMYKRLENAGLERRTFSPELIKNIQHPDSERNLFHKCENKQSTLERNFKISKKEFKSRI